jgi:hypothetical protein
MKKLSEVSKKWYYMFVMGVVLLIIGELLKKWGY